MATRNVHAVLFDLLMAVMNSLAVWAAAAGDERRGLAWRDALTRRMAASAGYAPYEELVRDAGTEVGLPGEAASALFDRWQEMEPWPDSAALARLALPYAFVTNSSGRLARMAAARSRLAPRFVLSAEEVGLYKPDARIYGEACRRLGSQPSETLFVAGSPYDAEGARAAGLQAVLVTRRPDARAAGRGVRVVASLEELVGGVDEAARPP